MILSFIELLKWERSIRSMGLWIILNLWFLREADYAKLAETQDYLAAKLLTIFMEYPIIFIGYSLNDPDIQAILMSISRCLGSNNLALLKERFIFLTRGENATSTHSITFPGIGEISMTEIRTNEFGAVYEAIGHSNAPSRLDHS